MMYQLIIAIPFGTQPAIESFEALKLISIIGLAAISGPLFIGGLIFALKKTEGRSSGSTTK